MKIVGKSFQDNREKLVQFIGQGSIFLPLLACSLNIFIYIVCYIYLLTICFTFWRILSKFCCFYCCRLVFQYRNSFHRHYSFMSKVGFGLNFFFYFLHTHIQYILFLTLCCFVNPIKGFFNRQIRFLFLFFPLKPQIST